MHDSRIPHLVVRLRTRRSFLQDGKSRREARELADEATDDLIELAAEKAKEANPAFGVALAEAGALGDGTCLEKIDKFLNSEFGKLLLDILKQLILGLV